MQDGLQVGAAKAVSTRVNLPEECLKVSIISI